MTRQDWERKVRQAQWRAENAVRARRLWTWVIILTMLLIFSLAFLGVTMNAAWFVPLVTCLSVGVPYLGWLISEEMPWYSVREAQRRLVDVIDAYAYAELRGEVTQ